MSEQAAYITSTANQLEIISLIFYLTLLTKLAFIKFYSLEWAVALLGINYQQRCVCVCGGGGGDIRENLVEKPWKTLYTSHLSHIASHYLLI